MKSDSSSNSKSTLPDPQRLRGWAPELSDKQFAATQVYVRELQRFNRTLNLISPNTMSRVDAVHVLDSIRAWTLIQPKVPNGSQIYDFGSGNGLPGLLSAVLAPDCDFRLVDRDQRKLEFCKHAATAMGLKNVKTLCMDIGSLPTSSVAFAVSRGFASVTKSLLMTRSLFQPGGSFFMLKGDSWSLEVGELSPRLFGVWKVGPIGSYSLPDVAAEFVVLQCHKIAD